MSLINEALKKAQRQRSAEALQGNPTPDAPPPGAPTDALPPASFAVSPPKKRRAPMPSQTLVLLVVGSIVLLLAGSGLGLYVWISTSQEPEAPPPVRVVQAPPASPITPAPITPAPKPPPVTPAPSVATPPAPAAVVNPAVPTSPASDPPATPPVASEPTPVPAPAPAVTPAPTPPVAVEPPPAPAPVITPAPSPAPQTLPGQPDPRVYTYLESLRVAGIRASAVDPKVIMNDRVFRLKDIVDPTLGLRLTRITASSLTFTDAGGVEYIKNF